MVIDLKILRNPLGFETSYEILNSFVVVYLIFENTPASNCFSARGSGQSTQTWFSMSALYFIRSEAMTSLLHEKLDSHRCHPLKERSRRETQEV